MQIANGPKCKLYLVKNDANCTVSMDEFLKTNGENIVKHEIFQKVHPKAKNLREEHLIGRNSDIGNQIYFPDCRPFSPLI